MTPNFIFRGGPFSLGWSTKTYHLCVCGRGRRGGYVSIHILKIPISRCGYKHDMSLEIRIILWVGHGMVDSVVREFSSALGKKKRGGTSTNHFVSYITISIWEEKEEITIQKVLRAEVFDWMSKGTVPCRRAS